MDVTTISMPAKTARQAYLEYRDAVRRSGHSPSAADLALKKGYRALSLAKRILNLHEVMRTAGLDENKRPRLAIARADVAFVDFDTCWNRSLGDWVPVFLDRDSPNFRGTKVVLPANTFPNQIQTGITAQVPIIPPSLRPKQALRYYHILWEADWKGAPRDPILLRRVHEHLFAVLAQWDLTELERAVLGLTLTEGEVR